MAIVKCKPTSAGRRHVVKVVNPELHKGKPFAALLESCFTYICYTIRNVNRG